MKKSESIESYFSRLSDIKNEMKLNQYNISDRTFIEKILNTLPIKFDHVVVVIQEMKDLEDLSIEDLHGSLILHEQSINETEEQRIMISGSEVNPIRRTEVITITDMVVATIIEAKEVHQILDAVKVISFNFRGGPGRGRCGNFDRENNFKG